MKTAKLKSLLFSFILFTALTITYSQTTWQSRFVQITGSKLTYTPDSKGNIIPDFSKVGYHQGEKGMPKVKAIKTVNPPSTGDAQLIIQKAIDEASAMPLDADGFRGAVIIKRGIYKIDGSIKINASGVILRGEGNDEDGTVLIATGKDKRTLVNFEGNGSRKLLQQTQIKIADAYVPVGATSFNIKNSQNFKVGDKIVVFRPGTDKWISDIKMDKIDPRQGTKQWTAKEYDLYFEREIAKIEGNKIWLDIPVVMAMEDQYGGGFIIKYTFDGRISETGIENILCKSEYASETDENHSWIAIGFNGVENGWARNVTAKYFAYSCVSIEKNSKFITVTDSKCFEAKSQVTGGRRYSFNLCGQMCLVIYCEATEGRHDFVTGSQVCGPNVFYNCKARNAHADAGPHHRWAVGTLYDNIDTDGEINVQDRGYMGSGHGWAGAEQVLWNCKAKNVCVQSPWASAKNYCIGLQGEKKGCFLSDRPDGEWEGYNKPGLNPVSLYQAQLGTRRN